MNTVNEGGTFVYKCKGNGFFRILSSYFEIFL